MRGAAWIGRGRRDDRTRLGEDRGGGEDRVAEVLARLGDTGATPDRHWSLPGERGTATEGDPGEGPVSPAGSVEGEADPNGGPGGRHRRPEDTTRRRGVFTVPGSLQDARAQPSWGAVAAVLVAAAVLALAVGWRVWQAHGDAVPRPVVDAQADAGAVATPLAPAPVTSPPPESVAADTAPPGSAPAEVTPDTVVVHVAGRVRSPGVVSVESGQRVEAAVDAAGGLREGADLTRLNLARLVVDGERIWVPGVGEEIPELAPAPVAPSGAAGGGPGDPGSGPPGAPAPVDLNTADVAALDALPGIGPVLAERIVQWREENGAFTTVEDLLEVSGIGEAVLGDLEGLVTV